MKTSDIAKLLDLISEAVSSAGSWKEKRKVILNETNPDQRTNLEEFCAWFEQ